jgi:hypothetical protein
MSNSIQPLAGTSLDSTSAVSGSDNQTEVSRSRQKELAAQLFKDLATAPLPDATPNSTPPSTPRVYG